MQKGKMFEEDLQIVEERREMKGKGEKERESVYNVSKERLLRGPQCGIRTQPSLAACEASVRAPHPSTPNPASTGPKPEHVDRTCLGHCPALTAYCRSPRRGEESFGGA